MDIEQLVGTKLGNYEIQNLLGRGGMGVVYKARQISLDRSVALKILPPSLSSDSSFVKRFQREAQAVAQLDHPNIVQIHDIAKAKGLHFFSMQYVEGRTLDEVLKERGRLDADEAVRIITQAAQGIEHAHKNGIIHRDIKPSNIILDDSGNAKVMDFGLARSTEERSKLTESGTLMGTLDYMSPEQCRGEKLDGRTDIYSLGVALYEALAGRTPFEAPNEAALINKIVNEDMPDIQTLNPDVPITLSKIIFKALAKDKETRYNEIGVLLEDLRSCAKALEPAKATKPIDMDMPVRIRRNRMGIAAGILVLAGLCIIGILFFREPKEPATTPKGETYSSIAVLPFDNMSSEPDQEHFCDGMAEELSNALSYVKDLRVISRTSASSVKEQNLDVREIGKRLNVEVVLQGSVRKAGNRLRITAQLVDTDGGHQLWSERFDREIEINDIFALQDEISQAIVDNLTSTSRPAVPKKRTPIDPELYDLYLRGSHLCWEISTEESLRKSIEYFEQVIEKAPDYAPAYSGLANSYHFLQYYGAMSTMEVSPKTTTAALKAIELDDTIAHAYTTLAWDKMIRDYDWEGAEKDFERAIKINPNYARAHSFYAYYLNNTSQSERAIREMRKALELDPLSSIINWGMGSMLLDSGQYDKGIEVLEKAIELNPNYAATRNYLGWAYELTGRYEEALREYRKYCKIMGYQNTIGMGTTYAKMGRIDEAQRILESWLEQSEEGYVQPTDIAFLYVVLGDKDRGFEWLERAYNERDVGLLSIKVDQDLASIRSDPRYIALLRKMNLEPPSPAATESKAPEEKTYTSIAVLPFADMSEGKDQEYFCDGMSETLINELTQIEDLRVIARTSAFFFKGQNIDVREIGKRLGVDTILEGSIQRAGNNLRITAQLVDTESGHHLWSQKYDRELEGIFEIQDDISRAVVDELRLKLTPAEKARLEKGMVASIESYDLCLRGFFFRHKFTPQGIEKAFEYFRLAIDKDPDCALGYSGLAECYSILHFFGEIRPSEAFPKAREFALKALELDETLGEAHEQLAWANLVYEWDWNGAEREFKRAVELNPGFANTRHTYATFLSWLGRFDEALQESTIALDSDPLSPEAHVDHARVLLNCRRYEQALEHLQKAIEMFPDRPFLHYFMGEAYREQPAYEKALEEFEKEKKISGEWNVLPDFAIGITYSLMSEEEKARHVLMNLLELSKERYVPPSLIGYSYLCLGEKDKAFEWVEKAYQEHDMFLCFMKIDTLAEKFGWSADPRHIEMLKKIGLDK
jgi:serine/threonine-protein kinase